MCNTRKNVFQVLHRSRHITVTVQRSTHTSVRNNGVHVCLPMPAHGTISASTSATQREVWTPRGVI